jgi:hypothetical protein
LTFAVGGGLGAVAHPIREPAAMVAKAVIRKSCRNIFFLPHAAQRQNLTARAARPLE